MLMNEKGSQLNLNSTGLLDVRTPLVVKQQPGSRQRHLSTAYTTNHIAEVVSLVSVLFFRKHWIS